MRDTITHEKRKKKIINTEDPLLSFAPNDHLYNINHLLRAQYYSNIGIGQTWALEYLMYKLHAQ